MAFDNCNNKNQNQKNKAVFLDRDGTINVDKHYTHKVEDFEFEEQAIDGLKLLSKAGFKLIVVTNQSGIARGKFTEEQFHKFMKHMITQCKEKGINLIEEYFFCSHHPEENCKCRKPETEMLEKAAEKFNIDLKSSYFIGDKTVDVECGRRAGCKTVLVRTGKNGKDDIFEVKPDFTADTLVEAAEWIACQNNPKVKTKEEIAKLSEELKKQGKKIVTTNGSFDLFHIGHIYYLEEAKKQGDVLIVGLNSDRSIKKYKSEDRPIIPEQYRAELVAALECVDYVTIFDDTAPLDFINNIKPDVHVNGAEYGKNCLEADTVKKYGRLHLIDRISGYSSTHLIQKIMKVYGGTNENKAAKREVK